MSPTNEVAREAVEQPLEFTDLKQLAPLTPDSLPFWQAAQEGILRLPRCQECSRLIVYPRSFCPHCQSDAVSWEEQAGDATVWSFTVVHHSRSPRWQALVPYIVAIVEFEPGARFTSRIVDCDPSDVRIGMSVEVKFVDQDGIRVPVFRPSR